MRTDPRRAQIRFQTALDLFEAGERMMRLKIARENPDLDPEAVEARLLAWLRQRPGAVRGDCPGRPRELR